MLVADHARASPASSPTLTTHDTHDLNDVKHPSFNRTLASRGGSYETSLDLDTSLSMSSGPASPESIYAVGTAPDEFYERTLPPWRAATRRFVMRRLQRDSEWVATMQKRIRSPWLDSYFVYTSSLGTHTFFMMALPCSFFFGYSELGRGLIFVLAMGVYVSSFIKDLVCSPRPYSPPASRLTIGSHHLEYGFPSTHSTNSVSMALFIYSLVHGQYFSAGTMSTVTYALSCIFLIIYVCSIVFGRLYTGMHSIVDCVAGVALGTCVWASYVLWWSSIENWLVGLSSSSAWLPNWSYPLILAALCGLIVHWHPQPADDCPCFEDAIAFVSVVTGQLVVRWAGLSVGFDDRYFASRMPGDAWAFFTSSNLNSAAWRASTLWWAMAFLKLTSGIALIFAWRLVAKPLLHALLPPLFRWISTGLLPRLVSINVLPKGVELPNRRFYTPATEYKGAVPEEEGGLHPIPSVIDLPAMLNERHGYGYGVGGARVEGHYEVDGELGGMKRRKGKGKGWRRSADLRRSVYGEKRGMKGAAVAAGVEEKNGEDSGSEDGEDVKHYDADVLTKVVVYVGIGILATGTIPTMFEMLGWGVHP